MNIGNDAVNVWIANFSASCRACLYSSAAEHWSRKPGVRSSILLGGCLPFFFLPFYIFFFALSFLQSLPQLKKKKQFEKTRACKCRWPIQNFCLERSSQRLNVASSSVLCTQLHKMQTPTLALPKWTKPPKNYLYTQFFFFGGYISQQKHHECLLLSVNNLFTVQLLDCLTNKSSYRFLLLLVLIHKPWTRTTSLFLTQTWGERRAEGLMFMPEIFSKIIYR